ncbi:MAG TPA: thioredoxin domain-containing protein [Terriglobia bacterium]|jgi:protein-disulfide isomerase
MKKLLKPLAVIVIAVGIAAGAAVYLSRTPDQPVEDTGTAKPVQLKGGHFRGPENAQVTLVEFGDYECPSCGGFHPFVKEILSRYPDKLRLEFHHFPLIAVHPNAMLGAMAAEAAGDQGKYWEMHDALFEHQREWGESRNAEVIVMALASRIGLDMNKFMQELHSPAVQDRILRDETQAEQLKLNETPSFLIDGQRVYIKPSIEDFVNVIEAHLHK